MSETYTYLETTTGGFSCTALNCPDPEQPCLKRMRFYYPNCDKNPHCTGKGAYLPAITVCLQSLDI